MLRFLATAAAFWVATKFVPGIHHDGTWLSLLGVAAVFGLVNTIVAPIVKLVSLPLIFVSLGLFALVINAAMLLLTGWIAQRLGLGLTVAGFIPAFFGSFVISLTSAVLVFAFKEKKPADD